MPNVEKTIIEFIKEKKTNTKRQIPIYFMVLKTISDWNQSEI